jgi:hypothetical protein
MGLLTFFGRLVLIKRGWSKRRGEWFHIAVSVNVYTAYVNRTYFMMFLTRHHNTPTYNTRL